MTNIEIIADIMEENKTVFKGFLHKFGMGDGIEFYVPKDKMDVYVKYNNCIVLSDLPKRKLSKLDDRFDWSVIDRKSKYKKYLSFKIFPHDIDKLTIHVIYGHRGNRFIISEDGIPLCVLLTNSKNIVTSAEFYNLPKYTYKYRNISNIFVDITKITSYMMNPQESVDTSVLDITFQCTQMLDGEVGVLGIHTFRVPKLSFKNEETRERIYNDIYDAIYSEYLDDMNINW